MKLTQPELFSSEETENTEALSREALSRLEVSKRIVGMLSEMRRQAAEFDTEKVFLEDITKLIERTRAKGKATPTQIEGLILYAIERQQCWTLTEIAEELKMDRNFIKGKLQPMQAAGLIRVVKRFVPGMFKPTFLIKSTRIDTPEAG